VFRAIDGETQEPIEDTARRGVFSRIWEL